MPRRINKNLAFIKHQFTTGARYAVIRGGTRSGKTYAALQFIYIGALAKLFDICSIVAPSIPHLKRGAMRDWMQIINLALRSKLVKHKINDNIFLFKTGAIVEFFSSDMPDRLRGGGRDWLFMNEVNTQPEAAFHELDQRTKRFVILDFNPVCRFWLNDVFERIGINIAKNEVVTTYKDNPYLDAAFKRSLTRRKALPEWWRVFGLGEYGEAAGRVIYSFSIVNEQVAPAVVGVDFGEGRSPSAVVGVARYGNGIVASEIAYGNLTINALAQLLSSQQAARIVGDSAQPDMINALRRLNVNILPCRKMSLIASYHLLNNTDLAITSRSHNLINELRGLEWSDRGAGLLKVGAADHAVDALRYAFHELA